MDIDHLSGSSATDPGLPPASWEEGASLPAGIGDRPLTEIRALAAVACPDSTAIVDHGGRGGNAPHLTHRSLGLLVARWAARLASEGVTPGSLIGLCAGAEIAAPAGFLAILEAGGAVVPLDPSFPAGLRGLPRRISRELPAI